MIRNYLSKKPSTENVMTTIKFTVNMTASDTQHQLFSKMVKLKQNVFGPPKGKLCLTFIDDFNMPTNDSTSTNGSSELFRQLFDYDFVYDRRSIRKMFVENNLMIATSGIPGGCWQTINSRVLRHFHCFSIDELCDETISRIFSLILSTNLKRIGHTTDVMSFVNQITAATLKLYHYVRDNFKPIPSKYHYLYNFRDILNVGAGCALLRKESVENKLIFGKIWLHEAFHVFQNRFIDESDRILLFEEMRDEIEEDFKENFEQIITGGQSIEQTSHDENVQINLKKLNQLLFGVYADVETDANQRKYEEIDFEQFMELSKNLLSQYNETHEDKLDIILSEYMIEHLNRICRIISIPGGNGLLIGIAGSGRKSLVKLAAFICRHQIYETTMHLKYNVIHWKEDVKRVLRSAGTKGLPTIFLLTDRVMENENFFTDVDHLLNNADIPNLWPIDEKQELIESVRLAAQGGNRNVDISPSDVFDFFVDRCKRNVHIILGFSPIGGFLRKQIHLFPSIVNCCSINWFDTWPDETLELIANHFVSKIVELPDNESIDQIILSAKYFYATAHQINAKACNELNCQNHITTSSYLEFIRCFTQLFQSQKNKLMTAKSRYVNGLETLQKAAETVETMQTELNELQPKLLAMAENCDRMTIEIENKTLEASVATEQVKRDELIANEQATSAEEMEDECSKDLAQAVPVLEDALQALNTLKPADITLVKSMKNPPSAVKLVMAAVCVMKAVPPDRINDAASGKKIIDYWGPSKRVLGDMGFLQSLKDYDKDDISPDIMKKIRKDFISHKDFQPHVVAKASSAAEGLCKWIKAIENFESVNTIVRPKKLKLIKAKELLKETRKYLAEKRMLAAELEAKVIGLNAELEQTSREKERTEIEVEQCERKLERAESLISSLGEEKTRWTIASAELQSSLDHLLGDILISSAFIAYLGSFNSYYRHLSVEKWHQYCSTQTIPCSQQFSLRKILGNEIEIQRWSIDGLCIDDFSIENIIIMNNSWRRCLFIDPQRQANKWIKRSKTSHRLNIVKLRQNDYFDVLMKCMQTGIPLLVEDIQETIDIILDPIMKRKIGRNIKFNENRKSDVVDGFDLYLTCNLSNPKYSADICNRVNIINFTLIASSLQEKLLNIVVTKENPYLREERDQLIENKMQDEKLLHSYEEEILSAIAESKGDILEDAIAIEKMNKSKLLCNEISDRKTIYIESERIIENFCELYKNVAQHATVVYSCLEDFPQFNSMYQFSLDWFIELYNFSIENANRSQDRQRRVKFLIDSVTKNLFNSVCRSIFENDKLIFVWILTTKILLAENRLDLDELGHLMNGRNEFIGPIQENSEESSYLSEVKWRSINALEALPAFHDITNNIANWKSYATGSDESFPEPWKTCLNAFQKLLIVKIFHPSKLLSEILQFIKVEMGENFTDPPQFDIRKSFESSNILTPIIFLLSAGEDPMDVLQQFAQRLGYAQSFQSIAMGSNVEDVALKLTQTAQIQGSWICLQNCHLVTDWLKLLEDMWQKINIYNTPASFRLWLTTDSTPHFPPNLIQNGIKIVYERPKGFKNNILYSYKSPPICSTTFYDGCPGKDKIFHRFLYSLCLFDIILFERKRFRKFQWNSQCDFNHNDLQISLEEIKHFINSTENIPFEMILYLIGECIYGGRISNEQDHGLLLIYLNDFLNETVLNGLTQFHGCSDFYALPKRLEYKEIIRYVNDTIKNYPPCQVFGLHSNADYEDRLDDINDLFHSMSFGSDKRMQTIDDNLSERANEIIKKIPKKIEVNADEDNILNKIYLLEIKLYDQYARDIINSCETILRAVEGNFGSKFKFLPQVYSTLY